MQMKTLSKKTSTFNKLYLASYLLCLVAFLFPSQKLILGGTVYYQYLLTFYPGWVVFFVCVLYGLLQGFFFYKTKKWHGWISFAVGLYILGFACLFLFQSFTAFTQINPVSLASKLKASAQPLTGLWLLAIGGLGLSLMGLKKILPRNSQ